MTIIKPTPKTIQNLIRVIPDHPRPGVLYQDMASIFNAPQGLKNVMSLFNDYLLTKGKVKFLVTLGDIKEGEELLVDYTKDRHLEQPQGGWVE